MEFLSYKKFGSGKNNIIFLHELMGDCSNYDNCLQYFNDEEFTCFMVDLRGYGLSKEIEGDYTLDEAVNDIINLVSNLGLNSYNLVAHSMSTMIAQHITNKDLRVKNLILITPISYIGVKSTIKAKENLTFQMRNNSGKIEEIVEQSSQRYNETWKKYRIKQAYNSSKLEARVSYMDMYLNIYFESSLNDFSTNTPIKIITGKHDFKVFSKNEVLIYFENNLNVEIIEFEDSGHYPMIESPVLFASTIEKWCR
ncbi:alpha/beta fold hydrolase [Arcobacter porcinus]|uniref:2-succinyl-6-hydroxy-2, 4-cyclohexadiene-1-carboxylate synthase n=1 Tax=Arcobacter porcinus TaxID=1935204 RepID=A0A1C0B114_9BACT|nr:alpha/beta hydrolase [Arcobacter porcinus]OCL89577.1 2-succinyl-6-hydroxy-2,4-cyclohexadiene-1-carboxylate synthase [Aliarcobacter thereius]OCL82902.1 2-succinyl-6-hydroxy-2,4-cyclohexadiene-1-carboxylate synthase [Arcobacter porcinus]OCL84469.1 2-succinyl-6-hydroxy-2,4-cyclohexadiene-1-carboxylate synthase [Arcobacter porcinus]OCL89010.1 2-succinyl-6-hydroxy-2,4-cyclohexadiene-1-carboxylate synthase [Arcobacter porcinus]OCL93548.1 2-succinyl-6-hydroxy-2,4-cyclohexadiene-1-carboxylate synth